ncbi:UNVERIFIED_CONTAM: peptidoglycan glycosyltransferase [Acetivibrio alkalicellulosi]
MDENKKIIRVLIIMCTMFFVIVGYLTYIQIFRSKKLMSNVYNRRNYEIEERTIRGEIFDRKGVLLAHSEKKGSLYERVYPYGALYSHVIGYNSRIYGKSLLESTYNNHLLRTDRYSQVFGMVDRWSDREKYGNSIYITLDHQLQNLGGDLLKDKKGAIVAIDPKTGEVLALVSKPDFDSNVSWLEDNWRSMIESQESPFLPRATQGLYVPGSVFKVVITAGAIENGLDEQTFEDNGIIVVDGKEIRNSGGKVYGHIDIKRALAVSSNVVYSTLGIQLGSERLKELAGRFGLGKDIPFDIPTNRSVFSYDIMDQNDMAAVAIGQGKIMVTPLQMGMIVAGIANGGNVMAPSLVKSIISPDDKNIETMKPQILYNIMEKDVAESIKDMMKEAVQNGTGRNAAIEGVSVAGKTGTAENELSVKQKNKEHAWFIGFAPVEDPKIAVAVVVEYGGFGGEIAAPIARRIMKEYLEKSKE